MRCDNFMCDANDQESKCLLKYPDTSCIYRILDDEEAADQTALAGVRSNDLLGVADAASRPEGRSTRALGGANSDA